MAEKISESRYLTIDNGRGLQGTFSSIGAGIYSLTLDGKPLLLTPVDKEVYLNSDRFFGKTLGRVAGRIPSKLNLNFHTYQLPENEPGVCLHGGLKESLSFKNFRTIIVTREDKTYVIFRYISSDSEAGFPGKVTVTITYILPHDEDALVVDYEATSDDDTILSLSNHMYFNFFGTENVNDYTLQVRASKVGSFKKGTELIEKAKIVTPDLDFTSPAVLKDKLDTLDKSVSGRKGLDYTFLFDRNDSVDPQIVLENDELRMEVITDYPAANIFVDDSKSDIEFTNGVKPVARRAIAIEPQCFPLEPFLLKPSRSYHYSVTYRFTRKRD